MCKYNIVDESGNVIKTVLGYWDAKRALDELKAQQQRKKTKVEYDLVKRV